jgi:hypothetical protein
MPPSLFSYSFLPEFLHNSQCFRVFQFQFDVLNSFVSLSLSRIFHRVLVIYRRSSICLLFIRVEQCALALCAVFCTLGVLDLVRFERVLCFVLLIEFRTALRAVLFLQLNSDF